MPNPYPPMPAEDEGPYQLLTDWRTIQGWCANYANERGIKPNELAPHTELDDTMMECIRNARLATCQNEWRREMRRYAQAWVSRIDLAAKTRINGTQPQGGNDA